ncbi:hypothetical protein WA026_015148 [Henosepilachna vigintioctopunctata]|uniref:Uncharacterized protein n=1 Tax=Henosepilachna vigintioctopunctata TaxID=420089 RepID=A0AAW1TU42_9CUCU
MNFVLTRRDEFGLEYWIINLLRSVVFLAIFKDELFEEIAPYESTLPRSTAQPIDPENLLLSENGRRYFKMQNEPSKWIDSRCGSSPLPSTNLYTSLPDNDWMTVDNTDSRGRTDDTNIEEHIYLCLSGSVNAFSPESLSLSETGHKYFIMQNEPSKWTDSSCGGWPLSLTKLHTIVPYNDMDDS